MTRPIPGRHWLDRSEGRRLFVAVPLGEDARTAVAGVMAALGGVAGPATPSGGSVMPPGDLPPSGVVAGWAAAGSAAAGSAAAGWAAAGSAAASPRLQPSRDHGRGEHGPHPRWVRPESLHMTLRFIGATPDAAIPSLAAAADEAAAGGHAFGCTLAGSGGFPAGPRPRVLWIGVGQGADELASLAARLEDALAARGWPRDDRPFRAHLTLARTDGVAAAADLVSRLTGLTAGLAAGWRTDRIVLYESITGGGPARYVPIHEAFLVA